MNHSAFRVASALVIIDLVVRSSWSQPPVVDHRTGQAAAETPILLGSEKWQHLLLERNRHGQDTTRLRGAGQIAEAIAACEKMLALERKLLQALAADKTPEAAAQRRQLEDDVAGSLAQLGAMHLQRDDFSAARKFWEEAFRIRTKLLGERHWKVTDARLALENVQLREKLSSEQRQRLVQAEQWHQEGLKEYTKGQLKQAVTLEHQVLDTRREILGLEHPDVAATCEEIALIYSEGNVLDGAEDFYRKTIQIRERRMGKTHPRSMKVLESLADVLHRRGAERVSKEQFADAVTSLGEALAIRADRFGAEDWRARELRVELTHAVKLATLTTEQRQELTQASQLNGDGIRLHGEKKYEAAVEKISQAFEIRQKLLGANSLDALQCQMNLALVAEDMGDDTRSEKLYRETINGCASGFGVEHPKSRRAIDLFATFLNNLATRLVEQEQWDGAIARRREVLQWRIFLLSEQHWQVTDARLAVEDAVIRSKLTAEDCQLLREAEVKAQSVIALYNKGQFAAAVEPAQQVLEVLRRLLGDKHPRYVTSLNKLAQLYASLAGYAQAEPLYRQARDITKAALGEKHPDYAVRLNNLALLYQSQGDYAQAEPLFRQARDITKAALGEKHPDYAVDLNNLAVLCQLQGDYTQAEPLYRQALAIRKAVLGDKHPDYAMNLNNLAELYRSKGDYTQAEPLYREARDILKVALGEKHPSYATSLNNFALLYQSQGDYAQAEPLYRQARDITKAALGEKHPDYAVRLNNLALHYQLQGDYAQAEPLYQQARDISKVALGEKHPDYARTLNNLAFLYKSQRDHVQAEPLYRQARDIFKTVLGEKHPSFAASLNNLAELYQLQGDGAQAEPLYRQARDILKVALGEKHPDYAMSLNNLAALYLSQEDYAQAEPLFRQACDIYKATVGEKHPDYARSLSNLAVVYDLKKDYGQAEPLYRQARDIYKAALGEKHSDYALSLNNLGCLYQSLGDHTQAEPLLRQACNITKAALGEKHPEYARNLNNLGGSLLCRLDTSAAMPLVRQAAVIEREHVEATAAVQSDRQQFLMSDLNRTGLDLLLTCDVTLGAALADDYGEVLHAKGRVWQRQLATRAVADRPELMNLFDELRSVSARRAKLTLDVPEPKKQDVWRRQLNDLAARQEALERDLSEQSATFRAARRRVTLEDLRKQLPAGTAVVDCFEYRHFTPAPGERDGMKVERRLVAFVIRADADEVRIVPLGKVEPLSQAIDEWRKSYGQSPSAQEAGQLLRQKIWEPLVTHLKDAKLVLFSPDGVLGRFPLAALPGKEPGSYLLEEVPLVVIPCVMALPQMLAPDSQAPRLEPSDNLLVVGDVNYKATSEAAMPDESTTKKFGRKQTAVRSSEWKNFTPLDGTRGEMASIEKLYREIFGRDGITVLEKAQAREERFKEEAVKHKYLHVATHGFFAPPALKSMLQHSADQERFSLLRSDNGPRFLGHPPGLLSGLAFAGANKTPELDKEDGILTASEVENLDLRGVQLAVLSACETGLGEVAGGEGLLGLQRAFQVAGAQSVVASLWQVSDDATRALMERFYDNLLRKELGTLESLREAQLWMLQEGRQRGLVRVDKPTDDQTTKRTPPFYWAAFVLSGDWR